MDLVRSCYLTDMRLWGPDQPPVPVQWMWAPKGAALYSGPTPFRSVPWLWEKESRGPFDYLGVQGAYSKGKDTVGYPGDMVHGPDEAWQNGGTLGVTPPLLTLEDGALPECEPPGVPAFLRRKGGIGFGGTAYEPGLVRAQMRGSIGFGGSAFERCTAVGGGGAVQLAGGGIGFGGTGFQLGFMGAQMRGGIGFGGAAYEICRPAGGGCGFMEGNGGIAFGGQSGFIQPSNMVPSGGIAFGGSASQGGGGGGPVSWHELGTATTGGSTAPGLTLPGLTVPAGSLLVVKAFTDRSSITGVTFGGVAMSPSVSEEIGVSGGTLAVFTLATAGSGDLVLALPSNGRACLIAEYITGLSHLTVDEFHVANGTNNSPAINDTYPDAVPAALTTVFGLKNEEGVFAWGTFGTDQTLNKQVSADAVNLKIGLEDANSITIHATSYGGGVEGMTGSPSWAAITCSFT